VNLNERLVIVESRQTVTQPYFQRLLLIGSGVSVLLLLSALLVAVRAVRQIDQNASAFASGQTTAQTLIQKLQRQQDLLNDRRQQLARRADLIKKEDILNQLADSHAQMQSALEAAAAQASQARENIRKEGHGLLRFTVELFATCVLLSLLCAFFTVRASAQVFRRLEQQARDLRTVQLQVLESQEQIARRFSHELHDELGQELTALKANLSALRETPNTARVDDCLQIVDNAVKNVRELSQLLRPTILDDFGLDAAMHWLTENFAQRTGIDVRYHSDLGVRRLVDSTETHLFRIAQEALTNVARHSQATQVSIDLVGKERSVRLSIRDNGRGVTAGPSPRPAGLGLVGMETRARGANGAFKMESSPGQGVKIEVTCPTL
jgi:signal transduction histidine kinase